MQSSTSSSALRSEPLGTDPVGAPHGREAAPRAPAARWYRAPGHTPLVRLRGVATQVLVKLESREPGGHLTDRGVEELLEHVVGSGGTRDTREEGVELVFERLDRLAISVMHAIAATPHRATVFVDREDESELRLRQFAALLGARLERVPTGEEGTRANAVAAWIEEHPDARLVDGDTPLPKTGRALALEITAQSRPRPTHVVLPPDGQPLAEAIAAELAPDTDVLVVDRVDPSSAALRDVQRRLGRQGILVGPDGAAVVMRCLELAEEATARADEEVVCVAVLPDGGHRHLGWWQGWGRSAD